MTLGLLPVLLIGTLLVAAFAGPRLLEIAAPALSRYPRTAVAVIGGGVAIWLIAFMLLGPLFAWMTTGQSGGGAVDFCRQCLQSSSPWIDPVFSTGVPTFVILAGPAVLIGTALVFVATRTAAGGIDAARTAAQVRGRAERTLIRGHDVLVTDDPGAEAFALPARHGGIVMSSGALALLDGDELDAVLAHEQAHLSQRHHLIAALSLHIGRVLRPIPFIRAATAAIPLYLEIAADDAARNRAGTRPLVSALLRLRTHSGASSTSQAGVLHAVGPHRIRTLLREDPAPRSRTTILATSAQSVILVLLSTAVAVPWLVAITTGCA